MIDLPTNPDSVPQGTAVASDSYAPPAAADAPVFPAAGDRYEIGAEIARGGMGAVHRGRDTAFGREVAVKLLLPGQPAASQLARRFFDEARITGQLQHPGIPPVYDLGTLPDGRPFLAMKLIKGRTLDAILAAGERVNVPAVFEGICQAVGYAHAHGVIHRDLKPANVMVGVYGEVQVMDWGLAKILPFSRPTESGADSDAGTGTAIRGERDGDAATRDGSAMGTPAYMPPEQARGLSAEIDRRSDVFGLGGVLCALLTGRPVYAGTSRLDTELMAANVETAAAFERLDGCGADPELVALCKRCLAAKKADRPADGNAVAADVAALRQAADDRAKQAEQDRIAAEVRSAEERKRRRQRAWAAGAVAAVLLLGIAGTTAGLLWADQARRNAESAERATATALSEKTAEEQAKAAALALAEQNLRDGDTARMQTVAALRKLTDDFVEEQLGRKPAMTDGDRRFLREVQGLWRAVADTRGDTPTARALRAEGAFQVGNVHLKLGENVHAEAELRAAAVAFDRLAADHPGVPDYRDGLARARNSLGILLQYLGRAAEAETNYRASADADARLAADHPGVPGYRNGLARARANLGVLLINAGRVAEAEAELRAAAAVWERLAADHPGVPDYRGGLATARTNLGNLLHSIDRAAAAEAEFRAAAVAYDRLAADHPGVPDYRGGLARARTNLGNLLRSAGRAAEAEAELRAAAAAYDQLATDYPGVPRYQDELARARINMGSLLKSVGQAAAAATEYQAAAAVCEKLAADHPGVPGYRDGLARARTNLGILLRSAGRAAEAEAELRAAAAVWEKLAADHPGVPDYQGGLTETQNCLGALLSEVGRAADSEAAYRGAAAVWEKLVTDHPGVPGYLVGLGNSYYNLGAFLFNAGRPSDSLSWLDRVIVTLTPVHAVDPLQSIPKRYLRDSHLGRALALGQLGRFPDALADWDRAVELSPPGEQPQLVAGRAVCLVNTGQVEKAMAEIAPLTRPPVKWPADLWYDFACVYAAAGRKASDKRDEYAGRAVELLRKAVAAGYTNTAHMWKDADLDPVRGRPDFRALLAQLGAAREPAPKPRPAR